ncbi:MAG: phosphate ABC transporter permease PstA [Solirubrobacteraceae bacterium]|nr:phosphate ABC transporter permease PstA [Solirubrobacteraceae bacterium]
MSSSRDDQTTPTHAPPVPDDQQQGAGPDQPGAAGDRAADRGAAAAPPATGGARPATTGPRPTATAAAVGGPTDGVVAPMRPITTGSLPRLAPWLVTAAVSAVALALILADVLAPGVGAVAAAIASGLVVYGWSRAVEGPRRALDRGVTFAVAGTFLVAITPLASLLYTVVSRGLPRFDTAFFTESGRNVVGAGGGAEHAIVGTLIITGAATLISVPIGIMAAIYLQEYGKGRLKAALTFFVDVMTGIPSIVAGLFAFALFSIFFGPGVRMGIMGAVALSVLMIPIVVRSTEEMLKIVPQHLREASYALGVPKWRTILKVVLPTALAGIVTGVMVAIARVMGETAPLLITTGVLSSTNTDPFDGRMHSLPVYAYNQYKFPGVDKQAFIDRAWAAALTLILIVMLLNVIARLIYRRYGTEIR